MPLFSVSNRVLHKLDIGRFIERNPCSSRYTNRVISDCGMSPNRHVSFQGRADEPGAPPPDTDRLDQWGFTPIPRNHLKRLARPRGFEPLTPAFGVQTCIQWRIGLNRDRSKPVVLDNNFPWSQSSPRTPINANSVGHRRNWSQYLDRFRLGSLPVFAVETIYRNRPHRAPAG